MFASSTFVLFLQVQLRIKLQKLVGFAVVRGLTCVRSYSHTQALIFTSHLSFKYSKSHSCFLEVTYLNNNTFIAQVFKVTVPTPFVHINLKCYFFKFFTYMDVIQTQV